MIKYKMLFCLCVVLMFSCEKNKNNIKYAVISFYRDNSHHRQRQIDSVLLYDKIELQIIENAISSKVESEGKFPRKYNLKIIYEDSSFNEYDGNGIYLRDKYIYKIIDAGLQKKYLNLINSKLPLELRDTLE